MNQSCVGTLVERKTGFSNLAKMQRKSALHVREGFEATITQVPDFYRLSMTYDRGAEMAQHPLMSKNLNLKVYFADRNAPWQRRSSENINGLLRQFLPKGENLKLYDQPELDHIAWLRRQRVNRTGRRTGQGAQYRPPHRGSFAMRVEKIDGDQRLIFSTPGGRAIESSFFPQFPGVSAQTSGDALQHGAPGVDAGTCVTRWRGEDCDYGMAVEALIYRDRGNVSAETFLGGSGGGGN